MRDTGRDMDRGRSRLPVGSPMQDSIPGPHDHNLSQRQMLNHWATQASLNKAFIRNILTMLMHDPNRIYFNYQVHWYPASGCSFSSPWQQSLYFSGLRHILSSWWPGPVSVRLQWVPCLPESHHGAVTKSMCSGAQRLEFEAWLCPFLAV